MNLILIFSGIVTLVLIAIITSRTFNSKKKKSSNYSDSNSSIDCNHDNKTEEYNSIEDVQNEQQKTIFTSGESEYYKEKLKDPRWLDIRKKVLIRDKNVCTECSNCINDIVLLRDNSELKNYTGCSQNIGNFISDIFDQSEKFINSFISKEKSNEIDWKSYLRYHYPEKGIFLYSKKTEHDIFGLYRQSKLPKYEFISTTDINKENIIRKFGKWLHIHEFYANNRLENISVFISYYPDISTDGKYYLKFRWGNAYQPFNGKWSLQKDGFIVSFDGDKIIEHKDIKLNVHHLFYNSSGNPWDCELNDLVTLCEKCHIAEHERLENKIQLK